MPAWRCHRIRHTRDRQLATWAAKRQVRLIKLGFTGIAGWSQWRIRTELGVGYAWLCGQLDRLGLRP